MFGGAAETQFDLRFPLFGIPVRVHPVFWLTAAVISWRADRFDLTIIGVLCVFVSILVHELGHAVLTRVWGFPGEIVLYFFGGYATVQRRSTWKDIATLIAGPLFGFVLFGLTLAFAKYVAPGMLKNAGPMMEQRVGAAVNMLLFANLMWNAMNLIPVYPLDGGQIARELGAWISPRNGVKVSLMLSIGTSGAMVLWAIYCIQQETGMLGVAPRMPAFFFGYMCYQGIQEYQAMQRRWR